MNRRTFTGGLVATGATMRLAGDAFASGGSLAGVQVSNAARSNQPLGAETILVGTSGGGSKGVYATSFNYLDGSLTAPQLLATCQSPSFLARSIALHPMV